MLLSAIVAMVCYVTEASSVPRSKYKDAPKNRQHISHVRHRVVAVANQPRPPQPRSRIRPDPRLFGPRPFGPAPPPPPLGVPTRPPGQNNNPNPRVPNNNAPSPGPSGQGSGRGDRPGSSGGRVRSFSV
ncbi:hypothetical protein ANCCAN_17884 [Ancylostoma caninum]|uniref:Uncharacterized protein n=1 Tax=Ancylostoma caninum TaxID=29170 RepID=A0A368FVM1_ANCCA|nr:hypothetical protein ANCCAN_17884 [Ancylostoma caninum]